MRLVVGIDAEDLYAKLDGLSEFAAKPTSALREISDEFLNRERTYLRTAHWRPLKPDSARRKLRRGRTTRPLLGGELERSLTVKGARFTVRKVSDKQITMGTRDPVAHLHQRGSRGGQLPRRPLISVSQADKDAYRGIIARRWREASSQRLQGLRGAR